MSLNEVIEISSVILAAIGGGAAIIFGFSSWLGKVWANRLMIKEKAGYSEELESIKNKLLLEAESYKIKLKKSELIFEKQFDAASKFVALRQSFIPAYEVPNMDWDDACHEIVRNFPEIERELKLFVSRHGAVLDQNVVDKLTSAERIAAEGKFEDSDRSVSRGIIKNTEELMNKLELVEKDLLSKIHSQSIT